MTKTRDFQLLHAAAGPAIFLLLVALPLPSMPYPIRGSTEISCER